MTQDDSVISPEDHQSLLEQYKLSNGIEDQQTLFKELNAKGIKEDDLTLPTVIRLCDLVGDTKKLTELYMNCGRHLALDIATYHILLKTFAESGREGDFKRVWGDMDIKHIDQGEIGYVHKLNLYRKIKDLNYLNLTMTDMTKRKMNMNVDHYNACIAVRLHIIARPLIEMRLASGRITLKWIFYMVQ